MVSPSRRLGHHRSPAAAGTKTISGPGLRAIPDFPSPGRYNTGTILSWGLAPFGKDPGDPDRYDAGNEFSPRSNIASPIGTPVDFGGHRSSGIAAIAYREAPRGTRACRPAWCASTILSNSSPLIDEDVLDRFRRRCDRVGPRLRHGRPAIGPPGRCPTARPAKCPPGHCRSVSRANGCCGGRAGRVLAAHADGALDFHQCHWPFLKRTIWTGWRRHWPEGFMVGNHAHRLDRLSPAQGRPARASRRHPAAAQQRIAPSSACLTAVFWRSANRFTAATASSCCWPANPHRRTSSSTAMVGNSFGQTWAVSRQRSDGTMT